jgi:membrane protein implicated in regulation of membrane protease activity
MSADLIWGAAGLLLVIGDVVFGTFFVMFLGAGALITATLLWAGIPLSPTSQWLIFSGVSAIGVILLRKTLLKWFGPSEEERFQEHKGQAVIVLEDVAPGKNGKVKYRGTEWQAALADGDAIQPGETAYITHMDGIVVYIRK